MKDDAAREETPMDRSLFDPTRVDPETRDFNAEIEAMLNGAPARYEVPPAVTRARRLTGEDIFPAPVYSEKAETRDILGPAGRLKLRVFMPEGTPKGVYLHIHGGGWVLGAADEQDPILESAAASCGLAVVSVDYRLAPEHPYPAGPADCEAAALWLVRNAKAEFGSERLLIGGESAGAHLSVVTLLRMRDVHDFTGFAGANLTYGVFDLALTPSARRWGERRLILTTKMIRWFADCFLPTQDRRDPDVSPLYADLARMPPALFSVGTLDPLLDDSLFMHARWLAAGNAGELAVHPGGIHGFTRFPTALAAGARERIEAFLRAA